MQVVAPPSCGAAAAPRAASRLQLRRAAPRGAALRPRAAFTSEGSNVTNDSYIVVGKAHCFEKVDQRLVERFVIEPITPASLESMVAGAPTSFLITLGIKVGDVVDGDVSKLPKEFADASFCEDWKFRMECAARTWARPHPQEALMGILPLGQSRKDWNFSLQDKRVLNFENEVSDSDNVKQDMSIDVYGRKE